MKKLGILGGMGPYASLKFLEEVLNITDAKKDWEHIHTILDSNTQIPSRTRNYIYNEKSPIPEMIKSINKLNQYSVDIIAIPCNSACYFLEKIDDIDKKNVVNIIEVTSGKVNKKLEKGKKIAIFGGYITYHAKTYEKFLSDYDYVWHDLEDQEKISDFIEKIKLNKDIKEDFIEFLSQYIKKYKVHAIILGCTEFSCLDLELEDILIIDSNKELAKYIVHHCLN
ncbi:MAG: amino acid racemase [Methanobrevibacter sp.]|jgi:aspartate racemase|nr:amino acid racemase [Candidatus Methanoflexus mossambicus]